MKKKLKWLADYKVCSLELMRVENTTADEEFRASNEIIEYKKGEITNVEMRDRDGLFYDLDKGHFFKVTDPNTYRFVE